MHGKSLGWDFHFPLDPFHGERGDAFGISSINSDVTSRSWFIFDIVACVH